MGTKSSKPGKTSMAKKNSKASSSSSSVASDTSKDRKSELERRIQSLNAELEQAKLDLRRLDINATGSDDDKKELLPSSSSMGSSSRGLRPPTEKKGYLFKWQDRSIGWGGTKWALRFVYLEHGQIAYYGSHNDHLTSSPRYLLNLRGCAVRDEGWKRNRRHRSSSHDPPPLEESGAYFFLFSIYLRKQERHGEDDDDDGTSITSMADDSDSDDVVPLLRFSTPSLAEKKQWIQLISETCAYCETDAYLLDEVERFNELRVRQEQQMTMARAMPEAKNDGTLPPLYFVPAKQRKPARHPSFSKLPLDAKNFRSKTADQNAEKVESRSTKGYPPSKPMHRSSAPSYLSIEAPPQNYRGLFNLGIIILIVSNFRLMLDTIRRHGFVATKLIRHLQDLPDLTRNRDAWQEFPFISGFVLQIFFTVTAFALEWLLSRKKISNTFGMVLHYINAHCALFFPMAIVWNYIDQPPVGAVVLLYATITWMKLVSYAHANEDYRSSSQNQNGIDSHHATLALLGNLEEIDMDICYPQNVTLKNLMYFWLAPTLTYQIAFPKYRKVRLWKVAGILVRMVIVLTLFAFLTAQFVTPTLENLVVDLEGTNGTLTAGILAEYWLKLAIANTYLWLLMFYAYFHLYLNLFAEILRFGDRVFYKDWWNSSEVSSYWRLWNLPVHFWLIRHIYFPCIRMKVPRPVATFLVFLLSAVLHEVLVSIPFHMVRPWSFLGMMMQVPLVATTKFLRRKHPGSSVGNLIFWISFCVVGQPMALLLYTVDYEYGKQLLADAAETCDSAGGASAVVESCRIMLRSTCIIP